MNSLGSSSKWPSYDSLTSSSSFIVSESEHTEDEADVFSEGEGYSGMRKSLSGDDRLALSENYLSFPAHSDQLHSRSKINQPERSPDKTKHLNQTSLPGNGRLGSSSATPGDLAFAQKCADLQKFICPLLELLHGLKTGRFDKGLSTFQQSVALDRLQRILGILQRPESGEKYLQTLLQIEMLLKIWFPQVAFQSKDIQSQTTAPRLQPHWHQNQLHMPVKKRKLSWSDPDDSCKVPATHKHHQHGSSQTGTPLDSVSTCLPRSPKRQKIPDEETVEAAEGGCAAEDLFTYSTGTLSKPFSSCSKREKSAISLASPCESPATQDSSVSSSDIMTTTESP